jgi:hypothetical protein
METTEKQDNTPTPKDISTIKLISDGWVNDFKNRIGLQLNPLIVEKANERMNLCKECAESTHCSFCGCASPQLFFSPYKSCILGKWDSYNPDDKIKL